MEATLAELAGPTPPMTPLVAAMLATGTPLVAAVNGVAMGIGMDIALLCDLRLASEHAKFGQLFVKMGLSADVTGYWRLPQLVGRRPRPSSCSRATPSTPPKRPASASCRAS